MRLEFDHALLGRIVARDLRALEGTRTAAEYLAAASRLHGERDGAQREEGFARLNLELILRRGHDVAIVEALRERPEVLRSLERVRVVDARHRRDEDVDLVAGEAGTLRLRLGAERFSEGRGLRALLRRQLVHVSDLLDPSFAYARPEPLTPSPTDDGLLRERYRLFWALTVRGRLGAAEDGSREWRRLHAELAALCARVPAVARERIFERLIGGPRPSHPELLAAARDTDRLLALASALDVGAPACRSARPPFGSWWRPRDEGHAIPITSA